MFFYQIKDYFFPNLIMYNKIILQHIFVAHRIRKIL